MLYEIDSDIGNLGNDMDVHSWRKVLLQWISQCGFIEYNYFNIEQTNLDAFFNNFCLNHSEAHGQNSIITFLETHYPNFNLHLDDENSLSSGDYIYIYSLLLHFCCVKCPDEYFHRICQKLPEQSQKCVAAFFKYLLDCEVINKENLRKAIAEVATAYKNSPPSEKSKNGSSSSISICSAEGITYGNQTSFTSSPRSNNRETQLKTPKSKVVDAQRKSPNTPKSFLLEERTRQLYNYKAQLETERYEKGLLELQIQQHENQIHSLVQVQKQLQQQIHGLKDEIVNRNVEPKTDQEDDEALKKRLYRKIHESEEEVFQLTEKIRQYTEATSLLENKMRLADKKVLDYREHIHTLELKLNELVVDLEKKETTIKCLSNDKIELEHFIAESRIASSQSRSDINSSNDCLDSSFTRYANNSSNLGSPENLGVSVIDVQLREKEHENAQLHDELSEMRAYNKKLYQNIKEYVDSFKEEYNFEIINADRIIDEDDPAAEFCMYVDGVNHLSALYKEAREIVKVLENDLCSLRACNDELRTNFDESVHENKHLKEIVRKAENNLQKYKQEIDKLEQLKEQLTYNYDVTVNGFQEKLAESDHSVRQMQSQIEALNEKIRFQTSTIEALGKNESKFEKENVELVKNCDELREQLEQFQKLNQTLQDTVELQNSKLTTHMEAERVIKKQYEDLVARNEKLEEEFRNTNKHLEMMSANIKEKEKELTKLGKEIIQHGRINAELEERIIDITRNFQFEKSKNVAQIQSLYENQIDAENQLEKQSRDLSYYKGITEDICKEMKSIYTKLVQKPFSSDSGNILTQLREIQEDISLLLNERDVNSQRILEMEKENKQCCEKLEKLGIQRREQAELNEGILRRQRSEIDIISERLQKAQRKIEQLEDLVSLIKEKQKQAILKERKYNEELKDIIKNLNSKHNEEHTHWNKKKKQLEAELNGEKEMHAAKHEELAIHVEKLADAQRQIEAYELQMNMVHETQSELQNNFREKISAFENNVQSLTSENMALQAKLQSKAEILITKVNEISILSEKYERTVLQLKTVELDFDKYKIACKNVNKINEKQISDLQEVIDTMKIENEEIESTLKREQTKLASKESDLKDLIEENKKKVQELKIVEQQRDEFEKEMQSAQNKYISLKQDLEMEIEELTKENNEIQHRLESAEEALESKKRELECLNRELKKHKKVNLNDYKDLQLNISDLEEKIQDLTSQNTEYLNEIEQLKYKESEYEERLRKSDAELNILSAELKKATFMIGHRNEKLRESWEMLTVASQKLEDKTQIWTSVELTCEKQAKELEFLRKKLAKMEELQNEKSLDLESIESVANLQSQWEHMKTALEEAESKYDKINEMHGKLLIEISKKEDKIQQMNSEFNQLQEQSDRQLNNVFLILKDTEEAVNDISDTLENIDGNRTLKPPHECDLPWVIRLKNVINNIISIINEQKINRQEIPMQQSLSNDESNECVKTIIDYENLEAELKSAKDQIEDLLHQRRELEKNIKECHEKYLRDLDNLDQVKEMLSDENASLLLQVTNMSADYNKLKAINEQLNKSQKSIESQYAKRQDEFKSEKEALNKIIEEKESEVVVLHKKLNNQQRILEEKEIVYEKNLESLQKNLKQAKEEMLKQLQAEKETCAILGKKCEDFELQNSELNTLTAALQKECITLRNELEMAKAKYLRECEEVTSQTSLLEESKANQKTLNDELAKLSIKYQDLERDFNDKQEELNSASSELAELKKNIETELKEKENVTKQLKSIEGECQELKNSIHNLTQKLALSDLEKEDLRRQLGLLDTKLKEFQKTSVYKLRSIGETSDALEKNILTSEIALKTSCETVEHFKTNTEKLKIENQKLRDNFDALYKRVEKMALKLGEAQGRANKLERENEKIQKANEGHITTIETLQRDKEIQQLECKTLKDRLNKMERLHEQDLSKIQNMEKSYSSLIAAKQKLELDEVDLKSKITKLENARQNIEERLRKMTQNYEHYERANVNLNHQIGGLNNEIQTLKKNANAVNNTKLAECNKNLIEMQQRAENYENKYKQLSEKFGDLQEENENLASQLNKALLSFEHEKKKNADLNLEIQQLEVNFKGVCAEKADIEKAHDIVRVDFEKNKKLYEEILTEKYEIEQKVIDYEDDINNKEVLIASMKKEIDELQQNSDDFSKDLTAKVESLIAEVEKLRVRLKANEMMLEKEQENNAQLRSDNQILQAKYREAKQRIETEIANREERIKENRLELEGKLEKMKTKMKALYSDEITKMKAKQEREIGNLRSELATSKDQNSKFEEHIRKLSAEIMGLNERMLEYQKDNTYLLNKLQHIRKDSAQFHHPNGNSNKTSTLTRLSSAPCIPVNMGTNLAMEDEEGEIFNNTYLTDMKNGRISVIGPEELQHRNSLLPPHLKSSYAVQYDHGLGEEDVKEGASLNGFDDSTSALISNNNSNCMRKKLMGVTHYRKPGPPTPSKNGGRLSLGGISDPIRGILKESYDDNMQPSSSAKTPARFSFFSSRFSMGNANTNRDEHDDQQESQQQQQCNNYQQIQCQNCGVELNAYRNDLGPALEKKNLQKQSQFDNFEQCSSKTKICTSTPRKCHNGLPIDRRRLINEILKQAIPNDGNRFVSQNRLSPPEISAIETPPIKIERNESQSSTSVKSQSSKLENTRHSIKGKSFYTGLRTGSKIAALQRRIRKRRRHEDGARPSLYVHKNLYMSKAYQPQNGALRDLKRIIGRKQRMMRFDKHREISNTSSSSTVEETPEKERNIGKIISAIDTDTFAINNDNNCRALIAVKNEIEDFVNTGSTRSDLNDTNDYEYNQNNNDSSTYSNAKTVSLKANDSATEMVTSMELKRFDEQLDQYNKEPMEENASNVVFEQLLKETASEAPFEIRSIRLSSNSSIRNSDSIMITTISNSREQLFRSYSNENSGSSGDAVLTYSSSSESTSTTSDVAFTAVRASPHRSISVLSPSAMLLHSRTIYGANIIFNRRIPSVDGFRIRKSSIYFKNIKSSTLQGSCGLSTMRSNNTNTIEDSSQPEDLVLVTNQTITIYDLICMWHQMNFWTRGVVSFIIMGCICAIVFLLYFHIFYTEGDFL